MYVYLYPYIYTYIFVHMYVFTFFACKLLQYIVCVCVFFACVFGRKHNLFTTCHSLIGTKAEAEAVEGDCGLLTPLWQLMLINEFLPRTKKNIIFMEELIRRPMERANGPPLVNGKLWKGI